jgi:uncharacterized membrane protein YbaN (DUF454 family)
MADIFVLAVREATRKVRTVDVSTRWWGKPDWVVLTGYSLAGTSSLWETTERRPGQVCLRNRHLHGNRAWRTQLAQAVVDLDGVVACRLFPWSHEMTMEIQPSGPLPSRLLDRVEQVLEDLRSTDVARTPDQVFALAPSTEMQGGVLWMKRPVYFALAAGSFAMMVLALIVPGMPTVPFLLATSYYLARSSPRLDNALRQTAFVGPILQEWEQFGALSELSKRKLVGLSVVVAIVSLAMMDPTPVALVIIVGMVSLSISGVNRMPSLPEEQRVSLAHEQWALPAPAG